MPRTLLLSPMALALAACMTTVPVGTRPAGAPVGGGGSASPGPEEVAELVNRHRQRVGCPALVWDAGAARAAQAHSDDMARRGYFAHASPEGTNVGQRLSAQGVRWRAIAENLAEGPATAEGALRLWLASSGHRRNLESCTYTHHGVGLRGGRWTHVFFTPLD
ncbi:MAG TPA: CAP domain-containing protein [Longimicrobium sp.]|nr:CAP domain-containing protein [Longimicrobium sp.]